MTRPKVWVVHFARHNYGVYFRNSFSILRDNGKDITPSYLTICQHDEYARPLRSMIFYPSQKTLRVLYGNPCQNDYVEFAIQITKK